MTIHSLYQETILAHNRNPFAHQPLAQFNHHAEGHNRSCGDRIEVQLQILDGIIEAAGFTGEPCAIAMASASLLMREIQNMPIKQYVQLRKQFEQLLNSDCEPAIDHQLGALIALKQVRTYPGRIKCAQLPFAAVDAAINRLESSQTEP